MFKIEGVKLYIDMLTKGNTIRPLIVITYSTSVDRFLVCVLPNVNILSNCRIITIYLKL